MVKHVFVHHFFQKRRVILHYFSRIRSDCSLFLGVAIVYLHSNFSEFQDWHRKARMRAEDVVNSWEMWPQQVLAMNNCLHNLWITCCLETVVILIYFLCIPYTYIYIYVNISYLQINVPWGSYLGVSEVSHFAVIKQLEVSSNRGTPSQPTNWPGGQLRLRLR
jgi:hypothetical protein